MDFRFKESARDSEEDRKKRWRDELPKSWQRRTQNREEWRAGEAKFPNSGMIKGYFRFRFRLKESETDLEVLGVARGELLPRHVQVRPHDEDGRVGRPRLHERDR